MEDSGVGSAFKGGLVIFFGGAGPYHKTFILSNLKPHTLAADDITDIMVCQTLKPYKKSPETREKLSIIVMLFNKTIIEFLENQDKWFVIL